jgi:hypothetical protein
MKDIIGSCSLADQGRRPRTNSKVGSMRILSSPRERVAATTESILLVLTISPDVNGRLGDFSTCGEKSPLSGRVSSVPATTYDWLASCIDQRMFMIRRTANGDVVLALIGRVGQENLAELKSVVASEKPSSGVVLDLKDVTLVDRETVQYLGQCERKRIELRNCPGYIRDWIDVNRDRRTRHKH